MHIAEILEVIKARFGRFQFDGVEPVARLERNLAADHLVLGLGVTLDVHPAHTVTGAFGDLIFDGHAVRTCVLDVGVDRSIRISTGTVETADRFDIVAHFGGGISVTAIESHRRIKFLRLKNGHASEADAIYGVFLAFVDRNDEIYPAIANGIAPHSRAARAEVALAAVVVEDAIKILIELIGLEAPGLGEP